MENNQTTVCRIPKLTIQREYVGIGTRLTAIRDQLTCWSHLYLTKKTSADLQNHYCFQFSGEFQPCWTEGACDVLIFVTFKTPVILKEFALHESCVKWKVRKMKKTFSYSFSPALRMRSAVVKSCVYGGSAVKMQQKESLAVLVNTRLTATQTSAVLSIKVQYSTQCSMCCLVILYIISQNPSLCFICAFSTALPRLLGQAHWAWALLWCLQPPDRAAVLERPGRGTKETLPLCRRSPLPATGVSAECRWVNDSVKMKSKILKLYMRVFDRRGSMCLKGEDSSEEDLTDSLYSEIDYII